MARKQKTITVMVSEVEREYEREVRELRREGRGVIRNVTKKRTARLSLVEERGQVEIKGKMRYGAREKVITRVRKQRESEGGRETGDWWLGGRK